MTHTIQYKQTCVLIQTFQRQTVTQDTTYCLSNPIKLYFIEYTYSIAHLTSWKWLLIVKIHRYWHFMSDTIWILHVSIPLCKSSHSQCDAGGEAAFFFFFFFFTAESTQQPNNHIFFCFYMYCSLYKNESMYTRMISYVQCLKWTKCLVYIPKHCLWESTLNLCMFVSMCCRWNIKIQWWNVACH